MTGKDLTMSDMANMAGIKDAGNYTEWFRLYPLGATTQAAFKTTFDARTGSTQPASEKTSFHWTQPLREQFIDDMHNLYRLNLIEAMALIERKSLDEFGSYDDVMNAVYAARLAWERTLAFLRSAASS